MLELDNGDLPKAKRALDSLIDQLVTDDALKSELAQARIDRATVGRFANHWTAALADLDAAESIANQLPLLARRPVLAKVYLVRAKIHSTSFSAAFDPTRAQVALDSLAELWPDHWIVEELKSHVAFQRGDWDGAAASALRAAAALAAEGWVRGVAACQRRAGEALLELGKLDESRAQLGPALEFFATRGPPDLLSEARLTMARLESRCSNHDLAWSLAQQALGEVESRVRRFVDPGEQQRYLLDKLRFYDHAFDIGLAQGTRVGWLRAWTAAERSKSFYLAHLLANADVPLFDGVAPELVSTLESLEAEMDRCERKLGALGTSPAAGSEEAALETKLRTLSDERSATLRSIMIANPRWVSLRAPTEFDADRLLGALAPAVTPVGFFWRTADDGTTLHVFARDAKGQAIHADVRWTAAQLDELTTHAERLRGQVSDYDDLFPDGMTERVLPQEICEALPAAGCLLVSPHGRLRGLPLHALPLGDGMVITRWPVQYVPSLSLPPSADRETRGAPVLLVASGENGFGDPRLEDVDAEVAELRDVWREANRDVTDVTIPVDATPDDAGWPPRRWSGFSVLHFACHGYFPAGRPLDAALRLGTDAVRGSELFAIQLSAEVVALSACALGQRAERFGGIEVVSEEWIGLYLPLFYAGARSLLVSLWDANSQLARVFMTTFHQALAGGAPPHDAFRTAVLGVRTKLPARWANWCLVGLPPGTNTG